MSNTPDSILPILLVEDDPSIGEFLQAALAREPRYELHWEKSLKGAYKAWEKQITKAGGPFALILLDLGLPDGDGQELILRLRNGGKEQTLIMVLSARGSEIDKVRALDSGADDYLTKPFTIGELLARLRAHFRRRPLDLPEATPMTIGSLELDDLGHTVRKDGVSIALTPKEYQLLRLFVLNQGRILSYQSILRAIWGEHSDEQAHYVRLYVKRLREKIEDDPGVPQYLITEKGIGYRLRDPHIV
ncbi:MAG: response regulator transcription factor [Acidithiobacillus sp.]|nr:response regulator transcription factor [Acidithiobacillus sp.]